MVQLFGGSLRRSVQKLVQKSSIAVSNFFRGLVSFGVHGDRIVSQVRD